jgi:ubiquinone biosynthesis protein UbiJ
MPTDTFGLGLVAPDTLISSVKITGSVDIAEALGFVFRHLKWDIESDLAALVGDIPAHRAYRIGTSIHKQLIEGTERISTNLVEFARNETNFLVTNFELTDFYSRVDYIRDDLARLEQRIKRL